MGKRGRRKLRAPAARSISIGLEAALAELGSFAMQKVEGFESLHPLLKKPKTWSEADGTESASTREGEPKLPGPRDLLRRAPWKPILKPPDRCSDPLQGSKELSAPSGGLVSRGPPAFFPFTLGVPADRISALRESSVIHRLPNPALPNGDRGRRIGLPGCNVGSSVATKTFTASRARTTAHR
jgi:hypothetical protein